MKHGRWGRRILLTVLAAATLRAAVAADGPAPQWRSVGGDAPSRRLAQAATTIGGRFIEQVRLEAGAGTTLYFGRAIAPAPVIEELRLALWVQSSRPGVQLLAHVVLPRSRDPQTGEPLTLLVAGSATTQAQVWEQLALRDLPRAVLRQAWVKRAELRCEVDTREAYVDALWLNLYTGVGVSDVALGEPILNGAVETAQAVAFQEPAEAVPAPSGSGPPAERVSPGAHRRPIRWNGSLLLVDERPVFVRCVDYSGESWTELRRLGFNAVRLHEPPTADMQRQAAAAGLWLIAPPPTSSDGVPQADLGAAAPQVLAWDLGRNLGTRDLEQQRSLSQAVRNADHRLGRPLVGSAISSLRNYSQILDTLLVQRHPLQTSLELHDYLAWFRRYPDLCRPGTPAWASVPTAPAPVLRAQWAALASREPAVALPHEQLVLASFAALAAGARGLCFESATRLDAQEPVARQRADALELLNQELALAEPWIAGGGATDWISSTAPGVQAALWQTDHARLLLCLWTGRGAQYVPAQAAASNVAFIVPGVPEDQQAYELTPTGLRPLKHQRQAGGVRVQLDEFGLTALVLITNNGGPVSGLSRRAAAMANRAATISRNLAAARLQQTTETDAALSALGRVCPEAPPWLASAREQLQAADRQLASGDYRGAYLSARRALRPLRQVERAHWERTVAQAGSPVASPLTVAFATLPEYWQLRAKLGADRVFANLLQSGRMEDLQAMLGAGWRHYEKSQPGLQTRAELSPQAPHGGRQSLLLEAAPESPENAPALLEGPAVWVTSPSAPLRPGQIARIHGWVNVPRAIAGSVDGLLILDSQTGEVLAERIGQTSSWREFTLYRAVTNDRGLSVTFALGGLGQAWIDDVSIEAVELQSIQPAAPAQRAAQSARPLR